MKVVKVRSPFIIEIDEATQLGSKIAIGGLTEHWQFPKHCLMRQRESTLKG